jgi:hypothetical protein
MPYGDAQFDRPGLYLQVAISGNGLISAGLQKAKPAKMRAFLSSTATDGDQGRRRQISVVSADWFMQ